MTAGALLYQPLFSGSSTHQVTCGFRGLAGPFKRRHPQLVKEQQHSAAKGLVGSCGTPAPDFQSGRALGVAPRELGRSEAENWVLGGRLFPSPQPNATRITRPVLQVEGEKAVDAVWFVCIPSSPQNQEVTIGRLELLVLQSPLPQGWNYGHAQGCAVTVQCWGSNPTCMLGKLSTTD